MASTLIGKKVPNVTFALKNGVKLTTDTLFSGKTVALFALPGAFTPTCSSTHLPRYDFLANTLATEGVDQVVCLSVNDPYVMDDWAAAEDVENVIMVPDGNGEFTQKMGMLVDKSHLGFGMRSWRYSMLVNDGVIEQLFEEDRDADVGDPFAVSDADTMLKYLNPLAKAPDTLAMIVREGCPHCEQAAELLDETELPYETLSIGHNVSGIAFQAISGTTKTPQFYVNGKQMGGSEAVVEYIKNLPPQEEQEDEE